METDAITRWIQREPSDVRDFLASKDATIARQAEQIKVLREALRLYADAESLNSGSLAHTRGASRQRLELARAALRDTE